MKNWNDAVTEQNEIAKRGLAAAHDHFLGLYRSLLDVYAELDNKWFFQSNTLDNLQAEIDSLRLVATPAKLELYGRWNDITPPEKRVNDASTERALLAAALTREHLVEVLQLQANVWKKVSETYADASAKIGSKAETLVRQSPDGFMAKFVDLETGVVKMTGVDLMVSLVPALSERAAEAQGIYKHLSDTIEEMKLDLIKFRNSVELKEYKDQHANPLPKYNWENPSDITQQRGEDVAAIREEMTEQTIRAFERAARLVEQADKVARYNERLARWGQLVQIVGAVASLGTQLAKAGDNRPQQVQGGNINLKVPKKGAYMEWFIRYQQGNRGFFDAGSIETKQLML